MYCINIIYFITRRKKGPKSLITSMLKVKPSERASLEFIRDHPWVNNNGLLEPVVFFVVEPESPTADPSYTLY